MVTSLGSPFPVSWGQPVGALHQEDTELYIYSYVTPARFDWEAIDILKALTCYEYQACEAPGWDTSTPEHTAG